MHRLLLAGGLVAGLLGPVAAAGAATTTFQINGDIVDARTVAYGSVSFTTPAGWRATNDAAHHTSASFELPGEGSCSLSLVVFPRVSATRLTPAEQISAIVGDAHFGRGEEGSVSWGSTGPILSGGEGEPPYPGIRGVSTRRFGARSVHRYVGIEIAAGLRSCAVTSPDGEATLTPGSRTIRTVDHVLATARTRLHTAPYPRR